MRVVFCINGEGFGHMGRSMSIVEELRRRGHNVTVCTYGKAAEKAKEEGITDIVQLPQEAHIVEKQGKLDIGSTLVESYDFFFNLSKSTQMVKDIVRERRAQALVIDEYMGAVLAAADLNVKAYFITTDVHPSSFFPEGKNGVVATTLIALRKMQLEVYQNNTKMLIGDYPPPHTIARYSIEGFLKKPYYAGPLVREKPESFADAEHIRKEFGLGKFILVSRGKSAEEADITPILKEVVEKTDYEILYINGTYEGERIRSEQFDYGKYYKYLKACDFVVGHGGHTTIMECCVFGKPMLMIVADGYRERMANAKRAEELNFSRSTTYSNFTSKWFLKSLTQLPKLKRVAESFAKLSKRYWGPKKVADLLESDAA